ncbi:MAG: alpha-amylase family glycosyl hydrolase [Pseudomonadota bacterium]
MIQGDWEATVRHPGLKVEFGRILRRSFAAGALMGGLTVAGCATAQEAVTADIAITQAEPPRLSDRLPQDEIIYFVMPDRFENGDTSNDLGGLSGDRLTHGFDPTDNGFYHGGDLQGLTDQLDYIQGLGATAVWLTPIFENKPVQGPPGAESSGYHGYWITDFLNVDPHLGTRDDFKAFVDAAHARGMKVYMDIITNHTADVIQYTDCEIAKASTEGVPGAECPYRSLGEYPWTRRGGADGEPINEGFLGLDTRFMNAENFAHLTDTDYAYTVVVPETDRDIKNPAWLNDPIHYHNRGHTSFEGESSRLGDFAGLDDLMTESPFVVDGMIEIYKQWITDFKVDGFRIDTAKHVNPEFWQEFIPAIVAHAESEGINHFHIFGEVYEFDPGQLAKFTTYDGIPTVLDFAFQGAVRGVVAENKPARDLERLFEVDKVYKGGEATALQLPTFLGNHDMGRFAQFLRGSDPERSDEDALARLKLAHAKMMFLRGVPTLYYGDEQGFVSDGGDRPARENMFPSQVDDYNDNDLIGTEATTAERNFDTDHPLYKAIAEMAAVRRAHAGLRRGLQTVRYSDKDEGVFVVSRFDDEVGREYVIAFNAETETRSVNIAVDGRADAWSAVVGPCQSASPAPGSYRVTVEALGYVICSADLRGSPS